ncbi:MAG: type II toxin-antitoxin system PemK/MazF family toxin [Bacteroidota bacterium]
MKKGDIILVPFPFTDLTGNKLRPALALTVSEMDVTVAFITTQIQWKETTDILLKPTPINRLKKESLIRLSKFATIDKDLIVGKLGCIDEETTKLLNSNLKTILKLNE